MPGSERFPFRRLYVDHLIRGETKIFWEMDRDFHDPLPHTFQIQTGNTMNANALDWVDVGTPIVNGFFGVDDEIREGAYGKSLTTHYRVKLTTSLGEYVSKPVHTFGALGEKDWVFARELARKERLRHNLVSVDGFLLRRMRFGETCSECTDPLTGEILDSHCEKCNGTGFNVGYHPPVPLQVDMNPEAVIEVLSATEPPGPSRPTDQQIRIEGFPTIAKHDIWVDGKSDQRWIFHEIYHTAEWRHVPIVIMVKVKLLPFTDQAYNIEIGGEAGDNDVDLPVAGTGDICIDHNYDGSDNLAYKEVDGTPIVGAKIYLFKRTVYDAAGGNPTPAQADATSGTNANGRWTYQICLCCGVDYVLRFVKEGAFGPDDCELLIPCSESSQLSSSSSVVPAPLTGGGVMGPQ